MTKISNLTVWQQDCIREWGRVLDGEFAHWCYDWDGLPIDETCGNEFAFCSCFGDLNRGDNCEGDQQ
jgi:hypothetical protein